MIGVTSKHLTFDGVTFGRLPPLRFDRLENWLRQCQTFRSDPERPSREARTFCADEVRLNCISSQRRVLRGKPA